MFREKPLISNQHGALVMAFVPFLYGIFASHFVAEHFWLGISWMFVYLFSYPFLAIFSKKDTQKYKRWAIIYAGISLIFSLPLLFTNFSVLQFLLPILPLGIIQIYYAKRRDERNLINDIAGFLIFGFVGMASFYVATQQYSFAILIHPLLFFITTTLYIKSVARERKNPRYLQASIISHITLALCYFVVTDYVLAIIYILALLRAIILPKLNLNIKQIGLYEFGMISIFLVGLAI